MCVNFYFNCYKNSRFNKFCIPTLTYLYLIGITYALPMYSMMSTTQFILHNRIFLKAILKLKCFFSIFYFLIKTIWYCIKSFILIAEYIEYLMYKIEIEMKIIFYVILNNFLYFNLNLLLKIFEYYTRMIKKQLSNISDVCNLI